MPLLICTLGKSEWRYDVEQRGVVRTHEYVCLSNNNNMYTLAGTRHMNENKYLFGCFNACASWHSNDKYIADKILTKITAEKNALLRYGQNELVPRTHN